MKDNSLLFKNMQPERTKNLKHLNNDVKLFKYVIKTNTYNILTSLTNISLKEMKAVYWKRWKVETENKKFKYDILSKGIRSKKYESFLTDLESVFFMSIISSLIEYLGKDTIKMKTKINSKNCLNLLYTDLLYLIVHAHYNKRTKEEICRIMGIIYKFVTDVICGRSHERVRVSPSSKWNEHGNRYGNKYCVG